MSSNNNNNTTPTTTTTTATTTTAKKEKSKSSSGKKGIRGDVPGCYVGQCWEKRVDMYNNGMHLQTMAGIDGRPDVGCYSIVLSGGYDDDEDNGEEIIYTGCGGFDKPSGEQTKDQLFEGKNASLVTSYHQKYPIRVIRGEKVKSPYAPDSGYRYDGLYEVTEYWAEQKKFQVCRYRLKRLPGQVPLVAPKENYTVKPRVKRQMIHKPRNNVPVALADESMPYLCEPVEFSVEKALAEGYCVVCQSVIEGGCTFEHIESHITELWNSFDPVQQENVAIRAVVNSERIGSVVDALAFDDSILLPTTSVYAWP